MRQLSIAESLREGIAEEMRRDTSVFCLGEDIAVPGGWGGAFTVTLGLEQEFPDRMLNTPIAELRNTPSIATHTCTDAGKEVNVLNASAQPNPTAIPIHPPIRHCITLSAMN